MDNLTYTQLSKNSKKSIENPRVSKKLAIMGDCATQHLATSIKGYAYLEQMDLDIYDADYNQIYSEALDDQSELYQFKPDYILIYMCSEKLYSRYCEFPEDEREKFAETIYSEIEEIWYLIGKNSEASILQANLVNNDDSIFGNYASKVASSYPYQLRKLNYLLGDGYTKHKNAFPIDLDRVQQQHGREAFYDAKLYYIAKVPLSLNMLPSVAKQVIDVLKSLTGIVKKCVVLDLDNTLWGGVIGDDGINGIEIGELGIGHAFSEFQMWLKELSKRGIILTVCSKNNEETAKEPFIEHDEMILRLDDIALFVANWDDKAQNIRYIQETLNIGMDSMVFLDDNPFERNLVKSLIPEITVPELPEDPALYLDYLINLNLFETASYSNTDKERVEQYKAEAGRVEMQKKFENFDEYLQSLEMVAEVSSFDTYNLPRISQLSQRSNQFNLRTIRYTEADIERIMADDNYITLYFKLSDKLSGYGLISFVIMKKQNEEELFIENWLMSCRVLKRGMEEFIINNVIKAAEENGFKRVIGEYIKTPKNSMVEHIYEKMGFSVAEPNVFTATVDGFIQNKTFIKE